MSASGWKRSAKPETSTGVGLLVNVPFPSWPLELDPQHFALPAVVSAHVWYVLAEIWAIPEERPETSTGVGLSTMVPSPSWPNPLSPQHFTPPPVVRAQVW